MWAGLLSLEIREVFTEKVPFEKIPERREKISYMDIWEKSIWEKSMYKFPETGIFLAFSRNIQEFSVAGAE